MDDRLSTYQLYCRKALKASFKRAPTSMLELGVQLTRSGDAGSTLLMLPEQAAAAEASAIGALRFVHMTPSRMVIASSDQGYVGSWHPSFHNRRGGALPTSLQTDAFAVAIGAKARRDARLKYAAQTHVNRLVFFKVMASNKAAGATGLDLWGGEAAAPVEGTAAGGDDSGMSTASETEGSDTSKLKSPALTGCDSVVSDGSDGVGEDAPRDAIVRGAEWVLDEYEEHARVRTRVRGRTAPGSSRGRDGTPSPTLGEEGDAGMVAGSAASKGRGKWSAADREKVEKKEARKKEKRAAAAAAAAVASSPPLAALSGAVAEPLVPPEEASPPQQALPAPATVSPVASILAAAQLHTHAHGNALDAADGIPAFTGARSAARKGALRAVAQDAARLESGIDLSVDLGIPASSASLDAPPPPRTRSDSVFSAGSVRTQSTGDEAPLGDSDDDGTASPHTAVTRREKRAALMRARAAAKEARATASKSNRKAGKPVSGSNGSVHASPPLHPPRTPEMKATSSPRGAASPPSPSSHASPVSSGSSSHALSSMPTLNMASRPRGSRLRDDVWFAAQFVRSDAPNACSSTLHAVTCYADGSLCVLAPHAVSTRATDAVTVCRCAGVVCGHSPAHACVETAQQLGMPSSKRNALFATPKGAAKGAVPVATGDAAPPTWRTHGITWCVRPTAEERDKIACVAVCKGRSFVAPAASPCGCSGLEPDILFAAFGRAVGVWVYTGPPPSALPDDRATPSSTSTAPGGPRRKGGKAAAPPVVSSSVIEAMGDREVDVELQPCAVMRVHSQTVTAVACFYSHAGTAPAEGGTSALPAHAAHVMVVSGDACGDVVLWHAATQAKVASLTLARKGVKEGVLALGITADLIAAGGSDGTVAIWRRRFHASGEGTPELLVRESNAHTIVRIVHVPHMTPTCALSCVCTGGSEGDVRVWPVTRSSSSSCSDAPPATPGDASSHKLPSSASLLGHASVSSAPASHLLKGHSARITGLFVDNFKLVSASLDACIKIWDIQEPSIGRPLQTVRLAAEIASIHVVGPSILAGTVDGRAFLCESGRHVFAETECFILGCADDFSARGGGSGTATASAPPATLLSSMAATPVPRKSITTMDAMAEGVRRSSASQRRELRDRGARDAADGDVTGYTALDLQRAYDEP